MTSSRQLILSPSGSRKPRLSAAMLLGAFLAAVLLAPASSQAKTGPSGFAQPFAGSPKYERYAPTQATEASQLNQPLGARRTARLARAFGLKRSEAFTPRQFRLFVSGRGRGGDKAAAKLVDESVRILTNTTGRPLYSNVNGVRTATVLASYGLMVNTDGLLGSPANSTAPTRQVNAVIEPGGYMGKWCRQNGAARSLRMLYRSAFTPEAVFGNKSQVQSGVAQLVPNYKPGATTTVGMSMAPSIYIVNFALIYMLSPSLAAKMPAKWVPIPADVASAIAASPTGQVPYSDYASQLPQ